MYEFAADVGQIEDGGAVAGAEDGADRSEERRLGSLVYGGTNGL